MYKTYEEWNELGCFVRLGQKSCVKNADSKSLFYINQVQPSIDHHEVFMAQLEWECSNPND